MLVSVLLILTPARCASPSTMPGILPMKVIKVGVNAQTRIAQACDRCVTRRYGLVTKANRLPDVEARRYAAMAYDHAALNVPTSASSAKQAISSVGERFPEDIQSHWRNEYAVWNRRFES